MAHSTPIATAAAALTKGEINYFYKDKHGHILKVLKPVSSTFEPLHKQQQEPETILGGGGGTSSYTGNGGESSCNGSNSRHMDAYNQMISSNHHHHQQQQTQFVRIQSYDNSSGYTMVPAAAGGNTSNNHESGANIHYESISANEEYQEQHQIAQEYESTAATMLGAKSELMYNSKYVQQLQLQQQHNTKNHKTKLHLTHSTNSSPVQKKRKADKAGKGLRHFSMKVCEKVKEKGTTTYNEVADELVSEEVANNSMNSMNCDQKNIRRRVYDALNVLMAMKIISKDKKEIRWIGLPENSMENNTSLQKENEDRVERINQKHQQLRELLLQLVAFKSLIERNRAAESQGIVPTSNSSIQLPFIIVNTHKSTKINCSVTNDKSEYFFKFDDKFEMHDDAEVLKKMGLLYGLDKGQCSVEDLERAKTLVPPNFERFIDAYGTGKSPDAADSLAFDSDDDLTSSIMDCTNDSQHFVQYHQLLQQPQQMVSPTLDLDDDSYQEQSD